MWSSLTCSTSVTRGIRRASWHARRTIRPPQVTNRVQRWGGGLPLSHAPRHMATQAQQLYTEDFFEDVWCILRGDAVLIMQLLGDRSLLPEACACPAFPMCTERHHRLGSPPYSKLSTRRMGAPHSVASLTTTQANWCVARL